MTTTIPAQSLGIGDQETAQRIGQLVPRTAPDLVEAVDQIIDGAQPMTRILPDAGRFWLISGDQFDALISARDAYADREQEAADREDRSRA